jgi:hypothetical protein
MDDTTHNPFNETHWVSCLRENLTSSSYGEGLETGRATTQVPRQSFTRQVWHRILKSGCHLEARQFQQAERLHRALALYSVLAWRIFYATMLARAVPEAPCSVLLEPDEWQALYCAIHRVPTPSAEPPTLGQAVTWIAQLGGFVGRRRSDRPGAEVLWRGFQHLGDLTTMYCIMRHDPP